MRMTDQEASQVLNRIFRYVCHHHSLTRALTPQLPRNAAHPYHLIVGIELVRTLRTRVEDRRTLISATRLSLTELHLGVKTLNTFFVSNLLYASNVLGYR
jgi:hypothetical protein